MSVAGRTRAEFSIHDDLLESLSSVHTAEFVAAAAAEAAFELWEAAAVAGAAVAGAAVAPMTVGLMTDDVIE
eukprot:4646065-Amphidinium_carterae.1